MTKTSSVAGRDKLKEGVNILFNQQGHIIFKIILQQNPNVYNYLESIL